MCTIPDLERESLPKPGKRLSCKHESHLRITCSCDMYVHRCHALRSFSEQLHRGLYRALVFITPSVHYHNYNIITTGVRPLMLRNSCLWTDSPSIGCGSLVSPGKNRDWNLFTVKCVSRNLLRYPVRRGMKANKLLTECFSRLIIGLLKGF